MPIMTDADIRLWAAAGGVQPYDPLLVNPASLDLRLGVDWIDLSYTGDAQPYKAAQVILYPRCLRVDLYNWLCDHMGMVHKRKPTLLLATTYECVTIPADVAAMVKLKTTPTREGLGHPIADWVDPGYQGQLTLMLHAFRPIELFSLTPVVQLVFERLNKPVELPYGMRGHYQGQNGPTKSWRTRQDGRVAIHPHPV